MNFRRYNNFAIATAILTIGIFLFPAVSLAASLSVSTDKSEYHVGDTITARIILSSADQATNAVSGVLAFPGDKLKANSINKSGSVINLWVKEPSFSASAVNFEGIILNPGYTGGGSRVISATFTAKSPGTASLYFSNGSILANDGQGTDILTGLNRTSINIIAGETPPPTTEPVTPTAPEAPTGVNVPPTPIITSLTNPDQEKWYNNPLAQVSWTLSSDITEVSYSINQSKSPDAIQKSTGLISSYTVEKNLNDGIWYFHLKLRNTKGWSPTATYAIKIDSTSPEALAVDEIKKYTDIDRAKFVFDGNDSLSGINRFEFKIDDYQSQSLTATTLHNYFEAPILPPGKHQLTVKAVDQAANISEKTVTFYVKSRFWSTIVNFIGNNIMSFISIVISIITLVSMMLFISHERRERNRKSVIKINPFAKAKLRAIKKDRNS